MSDPSPAPPASAKPWWATPVFHYVNGAMLLGGAFLAFHFGYASEGSVALGSALTFLGVGAGASTKA